MQTAKKLSNTGKVNQKSKVKGEPGNGVLQKWSIFSKPRKKITGKAVGSNNEEAINDKTDA